MKLSRILSAVFLIVPVGLSAPGCTDEPDFDDTSQLRPTQSACPPCYVGDGQVYLGISTDYDPSTITNVSVDIANSGGSELLDYGATLSVPNDPNTVTVIDSELCTVGRTEEPPTTAYVEFEITDLTGTYTVGEYIAIVENCS